MKQVIGLAIIAPILFLAACGTPYWHTSTFDQFPINRGRAAKGQDLIKVIALVPGGGVVADAIGVELAKRGFVVIPPAATMGMVTDVDLKAVHESYIPARRNPGEMEKLRNQLRAQGVDVFLVVRADRFNQRQWREGAYLQEADFWIHSTRHAGFLSDGSIFFGGWVNIDNRAKSPSEAAVEIVNDIAMHTSP